ncbi:MAG: hypothetical protein IPM25_08320 [Chloracidobacterium sp.]|nr:hypothetical protein [Chloracidobacterium sp.]
MSERRTQNSILFLTTLGVYLGILLIAGTSQAFAQFDETYESKVIDLRPPKDCEPTGHRFHKIEAELLWFNSYSAGDLVGVIETIFEEFPEKTAGWLDLAWTTNDTKRPLRLHNPPSGFLVPIVVDPKAKKAIDQRISELVNGFSAAVGFEYTVKRDAADTVSTLKLRFSGVDPDIFHAAYSAAFEDARCHDRISEILLPYNSSFGKMPSYRLRMKLLLLLHAFLAAPFHLSFLKT